jgi:hypothetical protein
VRYASIGVFCLGSLTHGIPVGAAVAAAAVGSFGLLEAGRVIVAVALGPAIAGGTFVFVDHDDTVHEWMLHDD